MRRYLTPEDRLVQRFLGASFRSLDRVLQVTRREISMDMLADQIDRLSAQFGEPRLRHLLTPVRPLPLLNWTGADNGTKLLMYGNFLQSFSTVGSTVLTITATGVLTFSGVGSGAGGGPNSSSGADGGGGGGSAVSTTGTLLTLVHGKTYTLVIPAAPAASVTGSSLTFVNTTDTVNLVVLSPGGASTSTLGGAAGSTGTSTGSNLVAGAAGGRGGDSTGSTPPTVGGSQVTGAGAGGGGGDATFFAGQAGGAGVDGAGEAGQGLGRRGGKGAGWTFNGTPCGWGGYGGGFGVGETLGGPGSQGGCKLAA